MSEESYVASARLRPEPSDLSDAVRRFARWCIQESAFEGGDLDGAQVQEKALELGLLKEVAFDPEKHDPTGSRETLWVDAGDPWFVFSDALALRPASSGRNLADAIPKSPLSNDGSAG
jgi:hypothetical protein